MVAPRRVRFLPTDIWDTPEDGNRYEVIDGDLYMTPPPAELHQRASSALFAILVSHIRQRKLGRLYHAPTGVVLEAAGSGVQPDLLYVANEHQGIISERGIEDAPDLVVEILSPSTAARDRGVKMRAYATARVPHYWIVDPRRRVLEAYKLGSEGYDQVGSVGADATFEPELFPGLRIPIDELWA